MKRITTIISILIILTSSCVVSKNNVGKFNPSECTQIEKIKDKNFYLFWNKVTINNIEKKIPYKSYEITKKRNAFDGIVFYGTLGICSFYTMQVEACKDKK